MDTEEEIKAVARQWLLRLSLESPTDRERAQFAAWRAQDPRHGAAYERFESIWQDAATLRELEPLAAVAPARDSWWRRLRFSLIEHPLHWAASASLMAAMAGIGFWFLLAPSHYATGIAEVRDIHLSDGSEVTLGARSSLEVAFRSRERRVILTSGVAYFSVVHNPSRPFVVLVGHEEVRDVGTKFEIRREPTGTRVSVMEGTVEVMQVPKHAHTTHLARRIADGASVTIPNEAPIAPIRLAKNDLPGDLILTAGRQVTIGPSGAIPAPQVMTGVEPAAWRHGRLVYVDTPLKDIIADANRYSEEPIEIGDESVANIRVSVTYPSDRIEAMVSALAHSLSLQMERREGGGIVLKAKAPSR